MSWSRRGVLGGLGLAGLGAGPLSGCFRPMLAADGAAEAISGHITLPQIGTRFSYIMVKRLANRLGIPRKTPRWRLVTRPIVTEQGLAIEQDNSVTRVTLKATAAWKLYPVDSEDPVLEDTAYSQSGYNATSSLYATRQTRLDIERRLALDLAERIARVILARADRLGSG